MIKSIYFYKINIFLCTDNTIQASDVSESLKFMKPSFVLKSTCPKDCLSNNLSETKIPPDFLTTYIEEQYVNETNSKKIIQKDLPKIIEDHILPKGTIKIMKINTNNESLQNNSSKQTSCIDNTIESTNILSEKEYHMSEINRSINRLKTSESTLTLNNNINLKNKNIDNTMHSTKIDHNDFLMETKNNVNDVENGATCEKCTLNYQEQSDELDSIEENENEILQDKKYNETNSDKNILNKNTSNLTDVSESCNVNRSLIVSKKEIIKQNQKRIAEESVIDIKLDNKKKKLNKINWQDNVTCTKTLNHQPFNDFSNINTIVTMESNITKNNNSEKPDLREHLNKKKLTQNPKLSASENKFSNKNNIEFNQVNLKKESDTITSTSTIKNEEFHKKLSFDKEPAFSESLYKEKDIQIDPDCNNHVLSHDILQSISKETQHINQIDKNIHENTNIQKKCTTNGNEDDSDNDDNDDGDCISLFAESFDTNL